jgi:hypothetical protein
MSKITSKGTTGIPFLKFCRRQSLIAMYSNHPGEGSNPCHLWQLSQPPFLVPSNAPVPVPTLAHLNDAEVFQLPTATATATAPPDALSIATMFKFQPQSQAQLASTLPNLRDFLTTEDSEYVRAGSSRSRQHGNDKRPREPEGDLFVRQYSLDRRLLTH